MNLRHRVALNNVQLDSVDDRIMITKVEETEGKEQYSAVSLWGGAGSRVTELHRDYLDIRVKFSIRLRKREMAAREEVLEKANAWAISGGWLTTNYKTNRGIRVFRMQAASIGDPWNWTAEYTIVFRACGIPYWQEENGTVIERRSTAGASVAVGVNGSEKTVLNAGFKNTSGSTVNSFTLNTGESSMTFSDLALANNETLMIDHDDNGKRCILRIRIRNAAGVYRSAMSKRTTGSSNDLLITPGNRTVAFTAGGAGTIQISICGRYA